MFFKINFSEHLTFGNCSLICIGYNVLLTNNARPSSLPHLISIGPIRDYFNQIMMDILKGVKETEMSDFGVVRTFITKICLFTPAVCVSRIDKRHYDHQKN